LAKEYGFNQTAIAGLSPDEEPTLQTLKNISDFAQKNNVQYIFFESLVSPKLSETIANEVGAKTLVLNPLEGLSMQDIAKGKNYFTEMRSNLNQLKIALQCQ
jgi:zinc transport system substrate-binding protein